MARHDALLLDESLRGADVSRAWLVWSGAAETALTDAYQCAGGPVPARSLVLGRGTALFRVVRLGGRKVRKARGNAAGAHDAADVFLYRGSSIAPLLDMRRRFRAVVARSVELTVHLDKILTAGPLYPLMVMLLLLVNVLLVFSRMFIVSGLLPGWVNLMDVSVLAS